jgi:hypothetical protein
MTITPVRLVAEGEPARHPSVINRQMSDVLYGSDYAADGSDFEGFAKKRNVPTPPDFERTAVFAFGDGIRMHNAGALRFVSIGLDYKIVGWRVRAFAVDGTPTQIDCSFNVERIAWGDLVEDLIGTPGTHPAIASPNTKAMGNPTDWSGPAGLGPNGLDGDHIKTTLVSVTPFLATYLILTLDFQPA